jgi:nickel-dependent lactate racemase
MQRGRCLKRPKHADILTKKAWFVKEIKDVFSLTADGLWVIVIPMGLKRLEISLGYGRGTAGLTLAERNHLATLVPRPAPEIKDYDRELEESLDAPIGLPSLADLIADKKPESALLLLSDHTRIVPGYDRLLRFLLERCRRGGLAPEKIRLLIASGTHRPPTCEERDALYGREALEAHHLYAHNGETDCISLGALSTGHQLEVNRLLLTHDLVIATGKITPHYLAGYSGGRKAVLPGCASSRSIAANHAMVARRKSGPGILESNPIHQEMEEAAAKVGIDFLLNVVPTPQGGIAGVFAGHWKRAFERGAQLCRQAWFAGFGERADCVIASAGGHPADIDLYQLQRVLNNVAPAVRPGGTIVLVGECGEGVGQKAFGEWMARYSVEDILAMPEESISAEAHRAYATAMVMEGCEVAVVSSIKEGELASMKFRGFGSLRQAVGYLEQKHGPGFTCYVVPQGYATVLQGGG